MNHEGSTQTLDRPCSSLLRTSRDIWWNAIYISFIYISFPCPPNEFPPSFHAFFYSSFQLFYTFYDHIHIQLHSIHFIFQLLTIHFINFIQNFSMFPDIFLSNYYRIIMQYYPRHFLQLYLSFNQIYAFFP